MPLIPLLPLFHKLNREHFDGTLVFESKPLIAIRWSDGRLRKTAGFYSRGPQVQAQQGSEIVLSRPILEKLPQSAIESTLCHEMIHAWTDLIMGVREGHGPHFRQRMHCINQSQNSFQVSVRHNFPVPKNKPKWLGVCPHCKITSPFYRRVTKAACRTCCQKHHGGSWNPKFLLIYVPADEG